MRKRLTFANALNRELRVQMRANRNIVLFGEDIGVYGGREGVTRGLLEEFGENRVIDMPLNEELFIGIAIGLAQMSFIPIVEFCHSTLVSLAQADIFRMGLWKQVCGNKFELPIILRLRCSPAFIGAELSSSVLTSLLGIPGIGVVAPTTPAQVTWVIRSALQIKKPTIVLEYLPQYFQEGYVEEADLFPAGKAEIRREGERLSIITYSFLTDRALRAAETLSAEGISAEVLDLVSLSPLDAEAILATSAKTKKVLVIGDEIPEFGMLYAKIHSIISRKNQGVRVLFLGRKDFVIPFGPLHKYALPSVDDIIDSANNLLD